MLNSPIYDSLQYGSRTYELTNHLGNVLATISDRKIGRDVNSDGIIDYFEADVVSAQDYYPFGMQMPDRTTASGSYRYGFNAKENDGEVKGSGNQIDYGERIYDPRGGRFLSVDPLTKDYPELTPYQFASNTPIAAIDIDGEEAGIPMNGVGVSGTPLSNYFDNAKGRKTWLKAMGTGTAVGGSILLDVFVTKGKITGTLITSQFLGTLYHHKANSPEQAQQRKKRRQML